MVSNLRLEPSVMPLYIIRSSKNIIKTNRLIKHKRIALLLKITMCSLKEVFQPHLPVRLPCYDLALVTSFTLDSSS
jgi:hypothetical protein